MNYDELNDNAQLYGNTKFLMSVASLKNKIARSIEKCEKEIDRLYDEGQAKTRDGKANIHMLRQMISCYELLYNENITTPEDYSEVLWLFNNGELREEEDIRMFCTEMHLKQPKITKDRSVPYKDFQERIHSIFVLLPYIVSTTVAGIPFLVGMGTTESNIVAAVIITIFAYIPCFFIFRGISLFLEAEMEGRIYEYQKKNNIEYKVNTDLILDAAVYGVCLGMTLKRRRK